MFCNIVAGYTTVRYRLMSVKVADAGCLVIKYGQRRCTRFLFNQTVVSKVNFWELLWLQTNHVKAQKDSKYYSHHNHNHIAMTILTFNSSIFPALLKVAELLEIVDLSLHQSTDEFIITIIIIIFI